MVSSFEPDDPLPTGRADDSIDTQHNESSSKIERSRRGIRFGLLELLLMTAVIAAWLSALGARRKISPLQSEIQTMRFATSRLMIVDAEKLSIRSLPTVWHNIKSWKYNAPQNADLELRLATDGIQSAHTFSSQTVICPTEYQSVPLPDGEHSMHLQSTKDKSGYHTLLYLDDDIVLQQHHPTEWLKSSGGQSTSDVSGKSAAYALDKPLRLKAHTFTVSHPLTRGSVRIPDGYDRKGTFLWISPRNLVPKPKSNFVTNESKSYRIKVGHRQGVKVLVTNVDGEGGLIGLQPSLSAIFGENIERYECPIGITVRPVTEAIAEPLPPRATAVVLRDSIEQDIGSYADQMKVSDKAVSQDGKSMRVFAHFQSFPSGAKPIVEIMFDAAHPNRVGFLPHSAPGSKPIQAVELTTRLNAKYLWRQIECLPDDDSSTSPIRVPISQLDKEFSNDEQTLNTKSLDDGSGPWKRIPLARIPQRKLPSASKDGSPTDVYQFSAITDVKDTSKIKYPASVPERWRYAGVANRQVWSLPINEAEGDSNMSIDLQSGKEYADTTVAIPGGPAIQNIRITIPMPAKQPVWLEIAAESEWKQP